MNIIINIGFGLLMLLLIVLLIYVLYITTRMWLEEKEYLKLYFLYWIILATTLIVVGSIMENIGGKI